MYFCFDIVDQEAHDSFWYTEKDNTFNLNCFGKSKQINFFFALPYICSTPVYYDIYCRTMLKIDPLYLMYLSFSVSFWRQYHYFPYQQLILTLLVNQNPEKPQLALTNCLTSVQGAFGLHYNFHPKQTKKELKVRNAGI